MRTNKLGNTDLEISELCLGSMTWGAQNTVDEGCAQIDMALDYGINILDVAEMYPVAPLTKETQGDTERVIGTWLEKSGRRNDIMIATKVSGAGYRNVRDGAPISKDTINAAIEGSLQRLKTDYVDLYQLHWPNRGSYMFRQNWRYDPTSQSKAQTLDHMAEVLETMDGLVKAGKVRHFGLSNESAWGTAQWLRLSEDRGLPRVQTIQNEYSLLCRLFDTDLAELCHNEQVGLLAYSPLATGLLTGKYQNGAVPAGSRKSIETDLSGRATERAFAAVDAYQAVADKHGLDLTQMSLAWAATRTYSGSVIFGATSLEQLGVALGAADLTLGDEVLRDIAKTHKLHPMPY